MMYIPSYVDYMLHIVYRTQSQIETRKSNRCAYSWKWFTSFIEGWIYRRLLYIALCYNYDVESWLGSNWTLLDDVLLLCIHGWISQYSSKSFQFVHPQKLFVLLLRHKIDTNRQLSKMNVHIFLFHYNFVFLFKNFEFYGVHGGKTISYKLE